MELSTQKEILKEYEKSLSWNQSFVIKHDDHELDLSVSIGSDAVTPHNAPDQPKHFDFSSKYRFPKEFDSIEKIKSLHHHLKHHCLIGADFITPSGAKRRQLYQRFTIRCFRFLTLEDLPCRKNFQDDNYVQEGVVRVTHKRNKSSKLSSLELLGSKTEIKAIRASKSSIVSSTNLNQPDNRRTKSRRAKDVESRCHCCINIFFSFSDNRFYLDTNSNLSHSYHYKEIPDESFIKRSQIDDDQHRLITILSNAGISSSKIAEILDSICIDDVNGLFDKKMISNLILEHQIMNEKDLGITQDMTSAHRAIKYLDRYVFLLIMSHVY